MSRPASNSMGPFKRRRTTSSHSESAEANANELAVSRPFANEVPARRDDASTRTVAHQMCRSERNLGTPKSQQATPGHSRTRAAKRARPVQFPPPCSRLPDVVDHLGAADEAQFGPPPARPVGRRQPPSTACPSRAPLNSQPSPARSYALPRTDDADGHLVYCLGDGLCPLAGFPQGRYKILSDLGEGTFGKVVECWDRREAFRVAVKIVRSVAKYRDAARLEIEVLEHLESNDPGGRYHCVRMLGWFEYYGHVCIVFEKLGPSLYEQLRRSRFQPFSIDQVREFAYQLLESVHFVHSLTLIHTDLKPENILFVDPDASTAAAAVEAAAAATERAKEAAAAAAVAEVEAAAMSVVDVSAGPASDRTRVLAVESRTGQGPGSTTGRSSVTTIATPPQTPPARAVGGPKGGPATAIKLIDFGSATFESHHHSAVISTRHYRAPEVILGLGWTYPCDLWSIGCILVELYTGQALFQTHENLEHLAMMHVVLGPIPDSMICRADRYSQKYFTPMKKQSLSVQECPAPSDRPPSRKGEPLTDGSGLPSTFDAVATGGRGIARPGRSIVDGGNASRCGNPCPTRRRCAPPIGHDDEVRGHEEEVRGLGPPTAGALSAASASGSAPEGKFAETRVKAGIGGRSTRTLNWPAGASSVASVKAVRRVKSLADIVKGSEAHANFLDLLHQLLEFEPDKRCTAADALSHPFFLPCIRRVRGATPTVSSGGESSICASHATFGGGASGANDQARGLGIAPGAGGGHAGPISSKRTSGGLGGRNGGSSGIGVRGGGFTPYGARQFGQMAGAVATGDVASLSYGTRDCGTGGVIHRDAISGRSSGVGELGGSGYGGTGRSRPAHQAALWDVVYRPIMMYGPDPASVSMPPPASFPSHHGPGGMSGRRIGGGAVFASNSTYASPVLHPVSGYAPYVAVPQGAYAYQASDGVSTAYQEGSSNRMDQVTVGRSNGRAEPTVDADGPCDILSIAAPEGAGGYYDGTETYGTPGGELSDVTCGPSGQPYGPEAISTLGGPRPPTGVSCAAPPRGCLP